MHLETGAPECMAEAVQSLFQGDGWGKSIEMVAGVAHLEVLHAGLGDLILVQRQQPQALRRTHRLGHR